MGVAGRQAQIPLLLRQLAVAVAYATCYLLLRSISVSHWNLSSGLRVLCLLLVPYRYLPAMVVGEMVPLAFSGWEYHGDFGWPWAVLLTFPPPLLLTAPLFAFARRRLPWLRDGKPDITSILIYVLIAATVSALASLAVLAVMRMPPAPVITWQIAWNYFLGGYLGALTLAPAFLALITAAGNRNWAESWRAAIRDGFVRNLFAGVVPPLLLLAWLSLHSQDPELTEVARMAVFLPVAWMTLRHGWRGAAVAGTLASVSVQLTLTVISDPALMQAQALVAFALSTLLMLGGRLQLAPRRVDVRTHDADEMLQGFRLAQQGLYQEEQRLRHVAESLDRLGHTLREGQVNMINRLRPLMPANMEQAYNRQLDLTQREVQRLANALHPRSWRERGLTATFEDGPLAQAAALVGAGYRCEISGCGLNLLAPDVHMMLYRQACEVLVYLLAKEPVRHIRLQIRGGITGGRRWVVLRVTASRAAHVQRGRPVPEWRQLISLLGTDGQGMATVRERAQIYGGMVHEREDDGRLGVTLLLHDALRIGMAELPMSYARPVTA
ncbi:MAG TPA: MASE1 domain-containing protein [Dyella sp.]|uniref:MASE1 domain-containing protein n=1 Tax=Dyella sp. TaxID=1869338 RepID=UPI002D792817|nr:MASE1 domain-containing protein [Dyella sp.]HET6554547.1 MASE1 domain-containing protein [Dyella sp.]